jgi:hypothetical protein
MGNKPGKAKGAKGPEKKNSSSVDPDTTSNENAIEKTAETTNGNLNSSVPPTNENGEDIHPSWNDTVLYNKGSQKVTKDDFELLTVIGKGSFGKVRLSGFSWIRWFFWKRKKDYDD